MLADSVNDNEFHGYVLYLVMRVSSDHEERKGTSPVKALKVG